MATNDFLLKFLEIFYLNFILWKILNFDKNRDNGKVLLRFFSKFQM